MALESSWVKWTLTKSNWTESRYRCQPRSVAWVWCLMVNCHSRNISNSYQMAVFISCDNSGPFVVYSQRNLLKHSFMLLFWVESITATVCLTGCVQSTCVRYNPYCARLHVLFCGYGSMITYRLLFAMNFIGCLLTEGLNSRRVP